MSAIMMMLLAGGGASRVSSNITISANTANYVLNTAKVTGYVAGSTDVTLTINSGVVVYSGSTGSYALQVDTSWAAGDTVTIINNGTILVVVVLVVVVGVHIQVLQQAGHQAVQHLMS